MKYVYVKDGRGRRHRVYVDANGNAYMGALRTHHAGRSKRSRTMDERKSSAVVHDVPVAPRDAYRWMRSPGESDIRGIDAPRGRDGGQQKISSYDVKPGFCYEWCSICDSEVVIPAFRESRCPICGERILPCSMCDPDLVDCRRCPYGDGK